MGTKVNFGELPDYYDTIKAAKYLNVAPWDLVKQAVFWRKAAMNVEYAESEAKEWIMKKMRENKGNLPSGFIGSD